MKRSYEALLAEYLRTFPCVGIVGPRQCGKTTLLGALPSEFRRYDLERGDDLTVVGADPDLFFRMHPAGVAIDEAQVLPALFPALRVAIDAERSRRGRFVITGSSSPDLLRAVAESLAGRLGLIEMAPFSFAEVHAHERPGFLDLLLDPACTAGDLVAGLAPRASVREAHDYWLRGGYPEPWLDPAPRFRELWTEQYVRQYIQRDVRRLFPGLNQERFRLFLGLLGNLSGSIVNYSDVARALSVSAPTAADYFEIAHGTFLWRRIQAFTRNAVKRVAKHPKGHLRDSGLCHHLLKLHELDQLLAHPQAGHSWEGMVVEELLRGLEARGVAYEAFYYRTTGGAEVDLILEGKFGLVAFEVKHAQALAPRSLRPLRDFVNEHGARLGVVVCNAARSELLEERLVAVPFTHL